MALEAGQRVGDYEIQAVLGTGGMGRVYSARNIISNRVEAMKVLLPDYASEPDLAARFMAEIRTLAGLEHPNIAQLRTAFQYENQLVMVMEFVEGITLEKLATQGKIPLNQVIDYSTQVLSALSYAHSRGVTHRDIKPANIMITSHGLVKLMDFGIAKSTNDLQLTRPGTTMGSVYYMSPEQVRGGTIDARSDIYSFGVTLYEMLTGRRPFQADTSFSVLNAQLNEAPTPPAQVNPELSPELNNIVLRAMVKHPDGRFQTADEFRNALKNLREGQSQASTSAPQAQGFAPVVPSALPSMPPASAAPQQTGSKSHRGLWIGLGAVAALIALVAAATLLPHLFKTQASSAPSSAGQPAPAASTPVTAPDTSSAPSNPPAPDSNAANPLNAATSDSAGSSAGGSGSTVPAANPAATSSIKPAKKSALPAIQPGGGNPPPQYPDTSQPQPGTAPASSAQAMKEARHRMIDLGARADAARAGVQQIRSSQQAQGLDLRGDILSSMSRMDAYLNEANRALSENNPQEADEYMDRVDKELSTLQSFLGR